MNSSLVLGRRGDRTESLCSRNSGDDQSALAALCLQWSNVRVEGQVYRFKAVKRTMHGPEQFDLLPARTPRAAKATSHVHPPSRATIIASRAEPHLSTAVGTGTAGAPTPSSHEGSADI